jgi:predicted Fe-S protein YdhL (DUF1289 family)
MAIELHKHLAGWLVGLSPRHSFLFWCPISIWPFRALLPHCGKMSAMSTELPPGAPELATPVPSPCISLCKMNQDTGFCEGCLRTIDEIVAWSRADDAYKRAVWAELRRREQLIDFD